MVYSGLVAGGGVRGGRVVGSSDARAEHVHDRPISPADLVTTAQYGVGVTSEQSQSLGIAIDKGKVIDELF